MIIPFLSRFFKKPQIFNSLFSACLQTLNNGEMVSVCVFYDLIGIIGQFLIFKKISLLWHTQLFVTTPTRK